MGKPAGSHSSSLAAGCSLEPCNVTNTFSRGKHGITGDADHLDVKSGVCTAYIWACGDRSADYNMVFCLELAILTRD